MAVGHDPHLDVMRGRGARAGEIGPGVVAFGMIDPAARTHALGESGNDHAAVPGRITVHQRSRAHPRDDLGLLMVM